MKIAKYLISTFFFFSISALTFSEDWCIYLGSFRNYTNATRRQELLRKNDIKTNISHYTAPDYTVYYRLMWEEHQPNKESADLHAKMLTNLPIVKKERINDIWYERLDKPPVSSRAVYITDSVTGKPVANAEMVIDNKTTLKADSNGKVIIPDDITDGDHSITVEKSTDNYSKTQRTLSLKSGEITSPNQLILSKSDVNNQKFLLISDSDTGSPITNADITIDKKWFLKSDNNGKVALPEDIEDGEHSFVIEKQDGDYVKTEKSFSIINGCLPSANLVSLPKAVDYDRIKIILTWGEAPSDLDSHIFSQNYHAYWIDKDDGNLNLDHDDTSSYGPETITIREPKTE